MSYNKRSKEYDWFKGQKNEEEDKLRIFKTVWKFSKIFLMFSLFFFSMWGCVQVFIIKTDNAVGKGVEFYQSEENISPRISRFDVSKNSKGLYTLNFKGDNEWLSSKKGDNLKEIQKQITKGTGKNDSDIKMSDAFKGSNEAFVLTVDGKKVTNNVSKNKFNQYLAFSTKAYKVKLKYDPNLTLYLSKKKFTTENNKPVLTFVDAEAKNVKFSPNEDQEDEDPDSPAKAVFKYKMAILTHYNNKMKENPDTKHLALSANKIDGDFNDKDGKYLKDKEIAHYNATASILRYYGASGKGSTDKEKRESDFLVFSSKYHSSETNYRPIVSWEQGWVRGVGPFYGLFVFPISKMATGILNAFPMLDGWESLISIVLIVFLLRIFAFGLSFKSVLQQTKQQELQAKKATIDAKYLNYKGNKQMEARQRQEVAELYKKEGISPLGAIGSIFLTMPIFLSIWRIIGGLPQLKSTSWLGMQFSATSYKELFAGEWQYLPLIIISGLSAAFSQLFPRFLTKKRDGHRINVQQKEAMKKNNKTQNIVLVVFVVMALIFSAGIQIYWIIGAIWQIIQTFITHHVIIYQKKKKKNRVKV